MKKKRLFQFAVMFISIMNYEIASAKGQGLKLRPPVLEQEKKSFNVTRAKPMDIEKMPKRSLKDQGRKLNETKKRRLLWRKILG